MILFRHRRQGYVFLVSVLIIGAIATAMMASLTLLGLSSEQNGFAYLSSVRAEEYARNCAERAFRSLQSDLTYDGGEQITFTYGSCVIRHTGGSGNGDRTLCIEALSGRVTRRMEIALLRVYPRITVSSWSIVTDFSTACP
jgi:hypothetical protein